MNTGSTTDHIIVTEGRTMIANCHSTEREKERERTSCCSRSSKPINLSTCECRVTLVFKKPQRDKNRYGGFDDTIFKELGVRGKEHREIEQYMHIALQITVSKVRILCI